MKTEVRSQLGKITRRGADTLIMGGSGRCVPREKPGNSRVISYMGWFRNHTLGDPTAVARYRQALRETSEPHTVDRDARRGAVEVGPAGGRAAPDGALPAPLDPVAELLDQGAGRRKIAAELNISEHAARKLVEAARNGDGR
jgi:hypothetical protein